MVCQTANPIAEFGEDSEMKLNELSFGKRIIFRLFGRVRIEGRALKAGAFPTPHYLVRCKDHGPYVSYAHGYGEWLRCPACFHINQEKGMERVYQKNLRSSYQILDTKRYERYWWGKVPSTRIIFEEWLKEPNSTMRGVSMKHGLNSSATLSRISHDLQRQGIMIRRTSGGTEA